MRFGQPAWASETPWLLRESGCCAPRTVMPLGGFSEGSGVGVEPRSHSRTLLACEAEWPKLAGPAPAASDALDPSRLSDAAYSAGPRGPPYCGLPATYR